PAAADERPAAVVEWRIPPWRAVDPRRAPSADVRPVTVAVWRPIRRHAVRKPHGTIFLRRLPRSVAIEIRGTDHLPRHIGGRTQSFVATIAIGAPRIEAVGALRVADVRDHGIGAGNAHRLPRKHLARLVGE